jgi:hypothetical protein
MADDNQLLNEHKQTWKSFVRLLTVSTIAVVVVLALMALFLL